MSKAVVRSGDVVEVVFLDHAEGDNEILFVVYGRVKEKDRTKIVVDCWTYVDQDAERDENIHSYTILRSAIKEMYLLSRKRPSTTKGMA